MHASLIKLFDLVTIKYVDFAIEEILD